MIRSGAGDVTALALEDLRHGLYLDFRDVANM